MKPAPLAGHGKGDAPRGSTPQRARRACGRRGGALPAGRGRFRRRRLRRRRCLTGRLRGCLAGLGGLRHRRVAPRRRGGVVVVLVLVVGPARPGGALSRRTRAGGPHPPGRHPGTGRRLRRGRSGRQVGDERVAQARGRGPREVDGAFAHRRREVGRRRRRRPERHARRLRDAAASPRWFTPTTT